MTFINEEQKFNAAAKLQQHRDFAVRKIKKILKPLIRVYKKRQNLKKTLAEIEDQNDCNSSLEDMRNDPVALEASDDNLANEALEARIREEIRHCPTGAAIIVRQGPHNRIVPVHSQQKFIPVHFARTSNGTFFWTSMDMNRQQEQLLRPQLDRWGQA